MTVRVTDMPGARPLNYVRGIGFGRMESRWTPLGWRRVFVPESPNQSESEWEAHGRTLGEDA